MASERYVRARFSYGLTLSHVKPSDVTPMGNTSINERSYQMGTGWTMPLFEEGPNAVTNERLRIDSASNFYEPGILWCL